MESILHTQDIQRAVPSQEWHSEIMSGGYRAVIFDCDGTLVESSEVHFQSFQAAVRAQGQEMARDWYYARTGLDRGSLFAAFSADKAGTFDVASAIEQSIQQFVCLSTSVTAIRETADLARKLRSSHPMAVGTNAELVVATASLRKTGMLDCFDHIVSISDDVAPKPAPDIFLLATERLGFRPSETVVFEDSAEGVRASLEAGLDVFQVLHG
jgi:HAD superfamily hydrolase (TIGR01509 family)